MNSADTLPAVLYAASAGAAVLAAIQLGTRSPAAKAYQAAAAFFAVLGAIAAVNVINLWAESLPGWAILAPGALLAALVPFLRLYVDDLTADTPRRWEARDLSHFIPAFLMLALTVVFTGLPQETQVSVLTRPPSTGPEWTFALLSLAAFFLVAIQSAQYLYWVMTRLFRLRARLRQVFASTADRELTWLQVLTALLIFNWSLTATYNLGLWMGSEIVFSVSGLAFTLVMASWAVRQFPAFQEHADLSTRLRVPEESPEPAAAPKYERSLLEDDRLDKIAARIETAFRKDQLHLDPALSLKKLSEKTGVSESNLSQTFTRKLAANFFDYVNRWRVEEAKARLLASKATIAEISFESGFNSRSAFYNAFKSETGQTPAAFRAAAR